MASRKNSRDASDAPPSTAPRSGSRKMQTFVTVDQVADALNVSPRSVRRWIKTGRLIAHRFGGAVRIASADLAAFLAAHRDS